MFLTTLVCNAKYVEVNFDIPYSRHPALVRIYVENKKKKIAFFSSRKKTSCCMLAMETFVTGWPTDAWMGHQLHGVNAEIILVSAETSALTPCWNWGMIFTGYLQSMLRSIGHSQRRAWSRKMRRLIIYTSYSVFDTPAMKRSLLWVSRSNADRSTNTGAHTHTHASACVHVVGCAALRSLRSTDYRASAVRAVRRLRRQGLVAKDGCFRE